MYSYFVFDFLFSFFFLFQRSKVKYFHNGDKISSLDGSGLNTCCVQGCHVSHLYKGIALVTIYLPIQGKIILAIKLWNFPVSPFCNLSAFSSIYPQIHTTYNVYRQQKKQMFTSRHYVHYIYYKMYKRKGFVDFENIYFII